MIYLRQSTASQSVVIGPFIDDTDGKTAETGLTIANTDIRLSKNGGNMAAKNSGGGTHDEAGWYTITLDATDTNTVGRLQASVHVAGALPVWAEYQVLEEAIYDALFASAATGFDASGRVDIGKFGGTTVTARDIGASVLLSNGTGAGQVSLSSGTVTVGTNNDKAGYSLTAVTGLGNQTANITGNLSGSVGSVSGAVGSVTGNVGGNVVGSVGSISGVTFPANFGNLAITVTTGKVTVGANEDKTGYSLTPTTGLGNQTADITGSLSGSVGSVSGAVGSVTGDVGGNVVGSVGSVANLTVNAGATLAAGTHNPQSGDAFARLGAPAGASVSADVAAVKTDTGALVLRITSTLFAGITSLGQWLGAMAGKQAADATAQTEIRATGAGSGTYDATTDAQEALRDRGDAAWITATGFSTFDPSVDTVTLADGPHGGTAAVLTLERVVVASATTNEPAVKLTGNGTGAGMYAIGASGADLVGQNGPGLFSRTINDFAPSTSLGSLTASLSAVAAGGISAGSFADNAISAAALAADAVAEIQSGLSTLDAAGVRAAVGLAADNLDTQLAALQADLDTITDTGVICTQLATQAKQDVNAEVLDVVNTDTLVAGVTVAESLRRIGAITSGRVSGAGSGTETFLDYAQSANSVVVSVDVDGNRTGVSYS